MAEVIFKRLALVGIGLIGGSIALATRHGYANVISHRSVPPEAGSDGEIASWTIETKADDWQTRSSYDFLRFEDFIQHDLASPIWRTVTPSSVRRSFTLAKNSP